MNLPAVAAARRLWDVVGAIPFVAAHLGCLAAFGLDFCWSLVGLCAVTYWVRLFAITAGFHRYFSHRGYKTSRAFQFLLALVGGSATQKGVLWWAAHHRHHHKYSDRDGDVHSPTRAGFWYAHVGWVHHGVNDATRDELIRDFSVYPELRFLNRFHLLPGAALAGALLLLGGLEAFVWGYVISTVLLWHTVFAVNSLSHLFGRRRFPTADTSRNSTLLAVLTLGEGWHNNHHYWPNTANQGFYWWQIDVTYYILRVLSWVGIVWGLRTPPEKVLTLGLIGAGASPAATQAVDAEGSDVSPSAEPRPPVAQSRPPATVLGPAAAPVVLRQAAIGVVTRLCVPQPTVEAGH